MKFIYIFFLSFIMVPLNAQIITTFAGNGTVGFSGNGGPATSAQLYDPQTVCSDKSGNVYVPDLDNHVVWKINSSNIISIFTGTGILGSSGDGGPAIAAKIGYPYGICSDNAGNIYITDNYNYTVRKVDVNGNISTIAGNGISGYSGDGGLAINAQLSGPCGICADSFGNIFFAEFGNQVIRKVSNTGIISTVAGTGVLGDFGDGGLATDAMLNSPTGVSVDNAGNIYIADGGNCRIRKVDATGIITHFAGNDIGYAGDGGPAASAKLKYPYFVYVDGNGNVYISDTGNGVLRIVTSDGTISTIAGNGQLGYSGDGGPATAAKLFSPGGICIDNGGNIYIADAGSHVIRKIGNCLTAIIDLQPDDASLCNSGDASFTITASNAGSYQWQVNTGSGFSNIADDSTYSGAMSGKLQIKSASPAMNNHEYRCIAANSCGNAYSSTATLHVVAPLSPSVSIAVTNKTVCAGSVATFTATSVNGGTAPAYQWKKNGINMASGNTWFAAGIADGDVISCVLTSNDNCSVTNTAASNPITMKVNPVLIPSIQIGASGNNICSGTPVKFSSTVINGGTTPYFQWQKNGITTGTNSPAYTDSTLKDGDVITCRLASDYSCVSDDTVISNSVIMKIIPLAEPSVVIAATKSSICQGSTVTFNAMPVNGGNSPVYQWKKNGLTVGMNNNSFTDASLSDGDVINCMMISDAACLAFPSVASNSMRMTVFQNPIVSLDKTSSLCSRASRQLDAGKFNSYLWNNGTTGSTLQVSDAGTYYVTVTDKNRCKGSDTTVINKILPLPQHFIPKDTSICSYGAIMLSAQAGYKNYLWSNNSNASFITVNKPGTYSLQVTDYNMCTATETVRVTLKQCMTGFYIPNAFTPNNDGRNDVFKPMIFGNVMQYSFVVYNRWGLKVFETSDLLKGWDGTFHGENADADVFVWICSYQFAGETRENQKGTVMLVR